MQALPTRRLLHRFGGGPLTTLGCSDGPRAAAGVVVGVSVCVRDCPCRASRHARGTPCRGPRRDAARTNHVVARASRNSAYSRSDSSGSRSSRTLIVSRSVAAGGRVINGTVDSFVCGAPPTRGRRGCAPRDWFEGRARSDPDGHVRDRSAVRSARRRVASWLGPEGCSGL